MNSPLVIEQVRNVVNREAFQDLASDQTRIQYLYDIFFQRPPSNVEIKAGSDFIASFQAGSSPPEPAGQPARGARGAGGQGVQGARGGDARGGARGQQAQGRGRGAQPPRLPLTGWQEYAHALLLTNEASFVN
jgi:hypothetical protein